MGIFKMFKKNKVEPSPPPVPGGDIKAPIAFDNNEVKANSEQDQFQDPFSSNENMPPPPTQESPTSFNTNNSNFNEIPEPPEFEKIDETNSFPNNPDEPFSPNVPDLNESNQKEIPSPFDQVTQNQEEDHFSKKIPTFAEKFGTQPSNEETTQPINEETFDNVQKPFPEEKSDDELNETENQTELEKPSDEDSLDDHEEFSFSNKDEKYISESELPLEDVSDKIEHELETISDKINPNVNLQKEVLPEETIKEEKIVQKDKEPSLINSQKKEIFPSDDSYFLSTDAMSAILNQIVEIKSDISNSREIQKRIFDIEKKSDTEFLNWKKNKESIHSLLLSMDKKIFR